MELEVRVSTTATALESLDRSWTVLLTTYKRDGAAVATPVNLAVEGDHAYFRSYDKAWKTKRIRNNSAVELAPCSVRGKPKGQSLHARARLLTGDEELHAREVIAHRHPLFQRFMIPFGHKISRYQTMHYEVSNFVTE
jgi:PPOX class probable F420-dependent enzyme